MISIVGIGAVTSVGLNALQTATSVRAGISRLRETGWTAKDGNPYRGGFLTDETLPGLNRKTFDVVADSIPARLLQLAGPALREVSAALPSRGESVRLVLGVRSLEPLQGLPAGVFLENLARQSQVRFDTSASAIVVGGRAAGLLAVLEAVKRIQSGDGRPIVAGGIDSYYDLPRLIDLDFEGRILNDLNLDGMIPGEGAGFVALAPEAGPSGDGGMGKLVATAKGLEPGHLYSDAPMLAQGMTRTLADLLLQINPKDLPCREAYVGLTGEQIGAKEWAMAAMRNKELLSESLILHHPAEAFGDAGAAMGPIMMALAARGAARGHHDGPLLVACSSDHGECVAACLAPGPRGRN